MALTVPTCRAYDPAFGYELAVIIEEGINAMFVSGEECFYYLTVYNESYDMPAMPARASARHPQGPLPVQDGEAATGRSTRCNCSAAASSSTRCCGPSRSWPTKYGVASTVYSATSYQILRRDAIECERLQPPAPGPAEAGALRAAGARHGPNGPVVASSDYMRALPEQVAPYLNKAGCWPWAPTGSAAARRGKACGGSSRWTPSTWRWRR